MKASRKADPTSPRSNLGDHGRTEAARKLGVTGDKIEEAKEAIERDYEVNRGIYPYANGKVSVQEVLRRAGLSPTALEKPRHAETKKALRLWVENVEKAQLSGAKVIRKAVTKRAVEASEEVRKIMQRWSIAELVHADREAELYKARRTITALEGQVATLEAQVLDLQADLAGGKVIRIPKEKAGA